VRSPLVWVRMNTGVAQTDLNENKGLDWLGIPGTNGPRFFEGGMPRFGVGGFTAWLVFACPGGADDSGRKSPGCRRSLRQPSLAPGERRG
jgi:hypothetical protein